MTNANGLMETGTLKLYLKYDDSI